jgi:hypothetical protein
MEQTVSNPYKELGPRWTRELLLRCTPREMLVIVAAYGAVAVAKRMGYQDVEKFAKERANVA